MWQTVLVLLILLGVSIYLVRYFVRAYRTEGSPCGGCTGCCSQSPPVTSDPICPGGTATPLICREQKPHDPETCS